MKFIKKLLKTILSIVILVTFSSCKGQAEKQNKINAKNNLIGEIVSKIDQKIGDIYQDQKGNYWFGSNENGVFVYDGENLKQYTKKDGLVNNTIRGIQGDNLGNIFIETPRGISKYDGTQFTTLKPIISSSNKWKLLPNDLWFGYNASDIYRYDGEFLYKLQLPRQDLNTAFATEDNRLPFKDLNHNPYAVYGIDRDGKGNLWVGTFVTGVFRYNGDSFLWIAEKELSILPNNIAPGVRSMLEDKDGNFWLSNFKSKYRVSTKNSIVNYEKLEGINKSNKLFKNRIPYFNSGVSDNNGDLWMTTYSRGVWKYDGETLLNFPIKDGEIEVLLISIYKDNQGTLWLGTDNAGVYKFNGETFNKFIP